MSEQSAGSTGVSEIPPAIEERPRRTRIKQILLLLAVAVVSLVVGVVGTTVFLLTRGSGDSRYTYDISIMLTVNCTEQQKAAIRTAVFDAYPNATIEFFTREQNYETMKKLPNLPGTEGDRWIDTVTVESIPESFEITFKASSFDCSKVAPIKALPGPEFVDVSRTRQGDKTREDVSCQS